MQNIFKFSHTYKYIVFKEIIFSVSNKFSHLKWSSRCTVWLDIVPICRGAIDDWRRHFLSLKFASFAQEQWAKNPWLWREVLRSFPQCLRRSWCAQKAGGENQSLPWGVGLLGIGIHSDHSIIFDSDSFWGPICDHSTYLPLNLVLRPSFTDCNVNKMSMKRWWVVGSAVAQCQHAVIWTTRKWVRIPD